LVTYSSISGTDYVKKYYNHALFADKWWADTERKCYQADLWYNQNRNRISRNLLQDVVVGKRVLDIGARGWTERELLTSLNAAEVVKLDIVEGEGIVAGDACQLPFPDESFDVVICRDVIEHVPDAEKAIDEARRVLRLGGHYFLTTPNAYNVCPDGTMHVRAYTPLSLLKELNQNGFVVIDKAGDVPNILHSLMPLAQLGLDIALREFKEIQEIIEGSSTAYYTGTFLYVLAQKI
jgi:SAM-dependent methyltransferase